MPLQQTFGNDTSDAYGGGAAAVVPNYIEDVFSTWLYTPAVSNNPITISNGIDLAGKGGMVWFKNRSVSQNHSLVDTVRGGTNLLTPNDTFDAYTASIITAFNSTGFTTGTSTFVTKAPDNYVSWTFRKQPKFFDIVTYTGNSVIGRAIPHSLDSAPGCVIVKSTDAAGENWAVWHRSGTQNGYFSAILNSTSAYASQGGAYWQNNGVAPDMNSTTFSVGNNGATNQTGNSYVAYLFAHDAGGFGAAGTDNVISCGSYTGNGSADGPTISLGYEPQFVIIKQSSGSNSWEMYDNMRGVATGGNDALLRPNTSGPEETSDNILSFTATGFQLTNIYSNTNGSGQSYIYIAIRRGPMKTPTTGTSVFSPIAATNSTSTKNTTNFPVDLQFAANYSSSNAIFTMDRLRGVVTTNTDTTSPYLITRTTDAEASDITGLTRYWDNTGFMTASNQSGLDNIYWNFRRAPGFFDEVCYTGTGTGTTVTHNLGVTPELMIIKNRSNASNWAVWQKDISPSSAILFLNNTATKSTGYVGSVTATTFAFPAPSVNTSASGDNFVAYLFASVAGVSKVGSYTGNGTTQTIDCGFTGGARFVLIRRTDSTGSWYVYDTARGMTVLTDPYLLPNSSAAQVATLGSVTTVTTGFAVNAAILAAINTSGASYIFLAIS